MDKLNTDTEMDDIIEDYNAVSIDRFPFELFIILFSLQQLLFLNMCTCMKPDIWVELLFSCLNGKMDYLVSLTRRFSLS